jgi:hypothetical protein
MLAVQVVRAPPSSVVVYTLVLVVPILRLASEIGTEVGLTSSVLAPVPEGETIVLLPPGTS